VVVTKKPLDMEFMRQLEETTRQVGQAIGDWLREKFDRKIGFCFMMFGFGDSSEFTYISNAAREDMIRTMRELADKLESGEALGTFHGPKN
jgi:hypothetical protein